MQQTQTKCATAVKSHSHEIVAAALAKKTAGGGSPRGKHHRQFVALDFGLHLAHEKIAMPGIGWNSLLYHAVAGALTGSLIGGLSALWDAKKGDRVHGIGRVLH